MRNRMMRMLAAGAVLLVFTASCGLDDENGGSSDNRQEESERRGDSYDRLVEAEPAEEVTHPGTRETVNFWIQTWGQDPGALAYVWLRNRDGDPIGYYVLDGLPVNACALLVEPEELWSVGRDGRDSQMIPQPAMDGVYYTDCGARDAWYGRDATTGAFIQFLKGDAMMMEITSEPLPVQDGFEPLGDTSVEEAAEVDTDDEG